MSNGTQPRLRTQPPKSGSQADALKRLEQLDGWTEEPAKAAADAIGATQAIHASSAIRPSNAAEDAQLAQAVEPAKPVQAVKAAKKTQPVQQYPWATAEQGWRPVMRQFNIRVTEDVYLRLKWLGETTYGSNMTQIAIEAITDRVTAMLKERGVK
jgi:hypothetical protein